MGEGEVGIKNLTGPLKVLLLFLSILAIIVPSVLGWVNFDARVDNIEYRQSENKSYDAKQDIAIGKNSSEIGEIKIGQAKQEVRDIEMFRRLDKIQSDLDKWEPKPRNNGE